MQVKLTVTEGKASKREVSVDLPVVVGRSRTAGLTIAHPMVSRQHCEIVAADGLLRIRDLGSTNGTYVGGEKVTEAVLRPHDQFKIGPLTFEVDYRWVAEPAAVDEPRRLEPWEETASSAAFAASAGVESAEPVEEFAPVDEPGLIAPAERPMEFVESGPDVSAAEFADIAPADGQVPDFSAWPKAATHEGGKEDVGKGDASGDSGGAGQQPSVLDSDSNPWDDATGEAPTATSVPFVPVERPKKKSWWPFGKRKADRQS